MKIKQLLLLLFMLIISKTFAGDNIVYTFLINEVQEGFDIPLVGLINTAHGNHNSLQLGFINTNEQSLRGAQVGFINTTGKNLSGLQISFINTTGKSMFGLQTGFVNSIGKDASFGQVGFINSIGKNMVGAQVGFINSTGRNLAGTQVGFINSSSLLTGMQIGFINATHRMNGFQLGFINSTKVLTGLQLGFINTVESADKGLPIGFLSFVRHGGYKALEMSLTEMYPYNVSFKFGMKRFYTFPILSYNPDLLNPWAYGYGVGSNLTLDDKYYFNPELVSEMVFSNDFHQFASLTANIGRSLTDQLDLLIGPSIVWNRANENNEFFSLLHHDYDSNNRLLVGLRVAFRYEF